MQLGLQGCQINEFSKCDGICQHLRRLEGLWPWLQPMIIFIVRASMQIIFLIKHPINKEKQQIVTTDG